MGHRNTMTPSIGINYSGQCPRGHLRTDALVGAGYRDWCGTLKELLSNKSSHKCFRLRPEPSQPIPVYFPSYFLLVQKTTSYWCKRQRARAADRFIQAKPGHLCASSNTCEASSSSESNYTVKGMLSLGCGMLRLTNLL